MATVNYDLAECSHFGLACNDFETFCANNGAKQTDMKAEYYLAGHMAGQERMLELVCKYLSDMEFNDSPTIKHRRERIEAMCKYLEDHNDDE